MQNHRLESAGSAAESSEVRVKRLVLESEEAVREILIELEPALVDERSGSAELLTLNELEDILVCLNYLL